MSDRHREIDQAFTLPQRVPGVYVRGPDFELADGRDAVLRLQRVIRWLVRVLVQVDKTRRDRETFRIDQHASREGTGGHGGDGRAANAHVANGVKAGFRIE